MKKIMAYFCAVCAVVLMCGCSAEHEVPEEYNASAFEAELAECIEAEKTREEWRFESGSGMNEEELGRCIRWLLQESPVGAYRLEEVTYSFHSRGAYDMAQIEFSYREGTLPVQEITTVETAYDAVLALISAIEGGKTEIALCAGMDWTWQQDVEELISVAATNAVTPAEFRDFSYSTYGGEQGIVHISMELPLDKEVYGTLDTELGVALEAAAAEMMACGGSAAEQYRAAHDYVLEHAEYDFELAQRSIEGTVFSETELVGRSAYGALCRGKTVCSGYAQAFQGICQAMELPCWTVYGYVDADTPEAGEHVWNAVLLNGEVFYVDCTFDDGLHSADYFFFTEEDPQYDMYHVYGGWIMPW